MQNSFFIIDHVSSTPIQDVAGRYTFELCVLGIPHFLLGKPEIAFHELPFTNTTALPQSDEGLTSGDSIINK